MYIGFRSESVRRGLSFDAPVYSDPAANERRPAERRLPRSCGDKQHRNTAGFRGCRAPASLKRDFRQAVRHARFPGGVRAPPPPASFHPDPLPQRDYERQGLPRAREGERPVGQSANARSGRPEAPSRSTSRSQWPDGARGGPGSTLSGQYEYLTKPLVFGRTSAIFGASLILRR